MCGLLAIFSCEGERLYKGYHRIQDRSVGLQRFPAPVPLISSAYCVTPWLRSGRDTDIFFSCTQDDAEAERRLAQAKRPQASAPAPAPKRQHFGPIDSDEEEEGVAEVLLLEPCYLFHSKSVPSI